MSIKPRDVQISGGGGGGIQYFRLITWLTPISNDFGDVKEEPHSS